MSHFPDRRRRCLAPVMPRCLVYSLWLRSFYDNPKGLLVQYSEFGPCASERQVICEDSQYGGATLQA